MIGAAVAAFYIARRPVRYKVWYMHPLECSSLALPDTAFIRTCLDSSTFRGRAAPLLRAALHHGIDSAAIARLADSAARKSYKRAVATNSVDDLREVVQLAQFADSVSASAHARFLGAAASFRAAVSLKDARDCASVRDAVRYFETASRYPWRTDVAMEPDTMRTLREIEAELVRVRTRERHVCEGSAPGVGETPR